SPTVFLENKELERHFFNIGFSELDSRVHDLTSTDSIIIESEQSFNLLDFYTIDLYELENKANFLYDFTNLIKRFNRQGFLSITFSSQSSQEIISSYFIELKRELKDDFNIEHEINSFFECKLIESCKVERSELFKILWRFDISDKYMVYKDIEPIFNATPIPVKPERELTKVGLEFENTLQSHNINFKRLSERSILIDNKFMFIMFDKIDYTLVAKVFKELYPKYAVVIWVIDDKEYSKITNVKKITDLPNVRIYN
ncbi:unnamed protein product, partial [marine sediment metagenome]